MSQTVSWSVIMYSIVNSNGPDTVPGYKTQPYMALFFVSYIIFGTFFVSNLFVGVVISAYNEETDRLGKGFLLTDNQRKWVETKSMVLKIRPRLAYVRPTTGRMN